MASWLFHRLIWIRSDQSWQLQNLCVVKLSNVVCNVEISDDFGLWMTKNGTAKIQIPIPTQQYYDATLEDPFNRSLGELSMSVL
jgi:hypothetical protein